MGNIRLRWFVTVALCVPLLGAAPVLVGYRLDLNRDPRPERLLDPANVAPDPSFEEGRAQWQFSSPSAAFSAKVVDDVAWGAGTWHIDGLEVRKLSKK